MLLSQVIAPLKFDENETLPVNGGAGDVIVVTVAVNVTFSVTRDGLNEVPTAVEVADCAAFCVSVLLVLGSKLPSPL